MPRPRPKGAARSESSDCGAQLQGRREQLSTGSDDVLQTSAGGASLTEGHQVPYPVRVMERLDVSCERSVPYACSMAMGVWLFGVQSAYVVWHGMCCLLFP